MLEVGDRMDGVVGTDGVGDVPEDDAEEDGGVPEDGVDEGGCVGEGV